MHIDPEEVAQILPIKEEVERRLLDTPGVTGVDVDYKAVNGEETSTVAIVVYVERKGDYRPEHEVPATVSGVPTDVVEETFTPHLQTDLSRDKKKYDPVQGGSSISAAWDKTSYGTLGPLVVDRTDRTKLWLSAYHVMCKEDGWQDKDRSIVQPACVFGGNPETDSIGNTVRGYYGYVDGPGNTKLYVDAAVCTADGRATSDVLLGNRRPAGSKKAALNDLVFQHGARTGGRSGVVRSVTFSVKVKNTVFRNQIKVCPSEGGLRFSEPGDSGATVLDCKNLVVGLLKGGSTTAHYSFVNPIDQIMEALDIEVPVRT